MINNFLSKGQVGRIATDKSAEAKKMIMERWENLGFLNGLSGYLKESMATIFENEATHLLNEATASDNSGSFETVVFPLVRRVFSRLLANDIVSVQAMSLPIGKLFFFLPKTSERRWVDAEGNAMTAGSELDGAAGSHYGLMGYERTDRRNGNSVNRFYLPDEVVEDVMLFEMFDEESKEWSSLSAKTYDAAVLEAKGAKVRQAAPEVVRYMKTSLYDLFYNDGLFDQSKGKIHIKVGEIVPVEFRGRMLAEASELPVYVDESVRNVIIAVKGFSKCGAGRLTGADGNEMDSEAFLASLKVLVRAAISGDTKNSAEASFACYKEFEPVHFRCVTQRYGRGLVEYGDICDADGKIYLELDLAKPTKEAGKTMDGYIGVDPKALSSAITDNFMVAWAQYDSLELETEIGEVSFELSDVTVSVEERKLRATWSPELAQDVSAFHNIDAEAELTAILSEQIAAEIDREILRDLRKAAPWQLRWDYNGWRRMGGFSTNYTQKDWNQTLITKVNQISAQIHKATLRGGANFLIVSTEISALLNDLEYFHVTDASAEQTSYSMGIEKIGSLQGRYQVYVDPYSPANSAIIGHKGVSLLDTGYIYAPYVPMQLTPVIYNYNNFAPVKGIMTRYAKKVVNNRYYGALVCDGLQTWNIAELR